jgi:uncharacterized damage-inducible protein DinB
MSIHTIRELFSFNTWANGRVLTSAAPLSDGQLDRPFEMGEGSLRATLRHIYGAERNWFERVKAPGWEASPRATDLSKVEDIRTAAASLAVARASWLAGLSAADLQRDCPFKLSTGEAYVSRLGDILMHVCSHGMHHRAQATNMLRHVGAVLPARGADYIFMYVETPDLPTPTLEVHAIRRFGAYGDWAFSQVLDAAAELSDGQLDQAFEMGMGTLRKTLVHIHDAERWWLGNWRNGPVELFPAIDETMSPARLRELYRQTASEREAFVGSRSDDDLRKPATALVRPGMTKTFPLGMTMLQVCSHGTHHRAQAVNMLRRLGGRVPELDWLEWTLGQ